jgi:hypothetical protein
MRTLLTAFLLLPALAMAEVQTAETVDAAPQPVQPTSPAPTELILPALPENPAPPPEGSAPAAQQQQTASTGQWVYTNQYGWVFMPYGNNYTYVPTNGDVPDMYVYYPSVGWTWVVAPWVWGWGAMPYFGAYGPGRYGWYGYGYGTWYGYRGAYAGWYGRGYWYGGHWNGYARGYPTPYHYAGARTAYGAPRGGAYSMPQRYGGAAGFHGTSTFAGHPSAYAGGFAGHPTGGFSGHAGGGFSGHAGGGSVGHGGGGSAGHGGGGHR